MQQLGSGVPRILESYPKECFKFSENFLLMTFRAEQIDNLITEKVDTVLGGQINTPIGTQKKVLTERQKEIINIIINDKKISRRNVAEKLKINESAVKKHLNILKDKGYIERIGGTRGYWKVNNSI